MKKNSPFTIPSVDAVSRLGLGQENLKRENILSIEYLSCSLKNDKVILNLRVYTDIPIPNVVIINIKGKDQSSYIDKLLQKDSYKTFISDELKITQRGSKNFTYTILISKLALLEKESENFIEQGKLYLKAEVVLGSVRAETNKFEVLCVGKEVNTCFCNRDFTLDEIENIIYMIRDGFNYKTHKEKFFDEFNEFILELRTNSIKDNKKVLRPFTKQLNLIFSKYNIDNCNRKIHFIAQMCIETRFFRATYEGRTSVPSNYIGGVDFQGRGMKQITHNYNYLEYFDYVNNTNHFKTYNLYRGGESNVRVVILNNMNILKTA